MYLIRLSIIDSLVTILSLVKQMCTRNRHHTKANMYFKVNIIHYINIILIILSHQCLMICTLNFGMENVQSNILSKSGAYQRTLFDRRSLRAQNPTSISHISPSVESGVYSLVYVTAPSTEVAKTLARSIISKELAACINLVPNIISIYKWEGEINEESETLMMIKTRTSKVDELTNHVKSHHPYKVCEVVSTKIENGNHLYLDWISQCVPETTEKK